MIGDNHVSLACFRYNSGKSRETGMSPYEAMFGIEPFMSWGPGELERISGEPYDLPSHLQRLHASLLRRGRTERGRAAALYNAVMRGTCFAVGDRVLV